MTEGEGAGERASGGFAAAAAVLLLSLGAAGAALAMTVETCTQGGADSLYGGFVALVLYLAGIACLTVASPALPTFVALLPAMAVAAWHGWFALRFAAGYIFQGMSACHAMNGGFSPDQAGEWRDGGEPLLIALWIGLSLLFWSGIVAVLVRARRAA
jgi:hypothetical protein